MPPELDSTTDTLAENRPEDTSIRSGLEAAFAESEAPSNAETAASTPSAATTPTTAPASGTTPSEESAAPAAAPAPAERPIPERLKAQYGDKWATLDPSIRETFHRYESDIGRLASTYGQGAKQWGEVQKIFAPYAEMVQKEGGTLHSAVSNLLETSRILRQGSPEQKIVLLRQTAAAFGVPLQALVGQPTPAGDDGGQPTPSLAVNEDLINRLNSLEREVLTTRGMQTHNAREQVDSEISAFTADPANVYLQEPGYLDTMAALIRAGKADDLPSAYQQAAWLHERTRQLEIAKQNQQRVAQQAETAARARRAGSSVNGSASVPVRLDPSKLSLRDTLAAAFDGDLDP